MIIIPRRAACILESTADDSTRFAMNCIQVREYEGQYWLVATDGKICTVARGPGSVAPIIPPDLDGLPVHTYLVHAKVWQQAWASEHQDLGFACDGHRVYVATPNGHQAFPLPDGRHPDTDHAIRHDGRGMLTMTLDPAYLKAIATMAQKFAGKDNQRVRLAFSRPHGPVVFWVEGPEGHLLEGLLMPLVNDSSAGYEPGTQPCYKTSGPVILPAVTPPAKPARKRR